MTDGKTRRLMSDDPRSMAVREAFLRERAIESMRQERYVRPKRMRISDRFRDWLAIRLGSWALGLGSRSFKASLRDTVSEGIRAKDAAKRAPAPTVDPNWPSKSSGSPLGFVCSQSDVEGY